jgi:hypothetical protein
MADTDAGWSFVTAPPGISDSEDCTASGVAGAATSNIAASDTATVILPTFGKSL